MRCTMEGFSKAESAVNNSKKLQDELQTLGFKIKQHEDNIKYLKTQKDNLDGSILDLQVTLGKYCSSSIPTMENEALSKSRSENETVEQILKYEKSAAAILCQLKIRHGSQASHLTLAKDVLGIVATLGKVDDENLSRPYAGDFVADDPQRRLDLLKPRLPNGECPPGFLGFAVNMINVDSANILCLTSSGCGLRETLFYNLFSRLQVYRTRAEMLLALPCITDGALSLDGGMIKTAGVFSLGSREDVEVRFPKSSGSNLPLEYFETEKELTEVNWKREKVEEDIQREQSLLNHINYTFRIKKQAFIKYLADSSPYGIQSWYVVLEVRL
ncbi:Protein defective in meristem silencing 3 [Vitis vinifera]|uniref:Protein defective in meristem silencing 3 n=1 Tax=Vitis vinifera TaxID=29760 RepID=A0A438HX36_VITVI|nr:Protein defective in meristem silencing 3 [Vitis vinifera]